LEKTCAHGKGKRGEARMRAWRRCGCSWYVVLLEDGERRYVRVGKDLAAARAEHIRLHAQRAAGRRLGAVQGRGVMDVAERWIAELAAAGRKQKTLAEYRVHRATSSASSATSASTSSVRRTSRSGGQSSPASARPTRST
jgi:hypothetical protein